MIPMVSRLLVEERVLDALLLPDPSWTCWDGGAYTLYVNETHRVLRGHALHLMVHTERKAPRYELSVYVGSAYSDNLILISGSSRLEHVVRAIDERAPRFTHDDAALYRLLMSIKHQK